ncbi:DUF1080 domain-containing protein [Pseudocolwellia sp. AS88]|uniref:3-keto-disaccharide hydrolase n=1 Tax=Pseudocolwellia sp. AS88 TaxID=3063958 RepID=UPI0026EC1E4F|nr:DUF1080 domain-containing protein [Pseudocolwellia sp. AS88]MDO7085566.1 DUF1080 domain-containing protein [Pseudocolwellia sp. AS88]
MMKRITNATNTLTRVVVFLILALPHFSFAVQSNDAVEPGVKGKDTIELLTTNNFSGWKVPSTNWSVVDNTIIGSTGNKKLSTPEWLYTKQRFKNFEFTCDVKLTGDDRRNTGIYFRVNTFIFKSARGNKSFEAPSGYEFDLARHNPEKHNFWGALGDWFSRKKLRIFADQNLISNTYTPQEWNRLTIRARDKRIEYWINGIKVMDYIDEDPNASREGNIGFQLHDGTVMRVAYKNIRVRKLN